MEPIRILIADALDAEGIRFLESQPGAQVTNKPGMEPDALAEAIARHHGVVVRSAVKITAEVIERAFSDPNCQLRAIARAGVGVDNINLEAATKHGVVVMNSASASTITTAEQAFALMIGLARNIGQASQSMAKGAWDRNKFTGTQLHGKTIGIVGMGRIGQTLAQRSIAFGMKVIGYDPFVNAESLLDGQAPMVKNFDDLIPHVDIVSFHVPKTADTKGMLGAAQFAKARKGLLVVNASRGGIVDEKALLAALDAGQCGGAALDVFEQEPPAADSPLRTHPKILCTPHLGASTFEAQEAVAVDACRALLTYLQGEGASGAVNAGGLELNLSDRQKALVDLAKRMVALLGAASEPKRIKSVRFNCRGESVASRADTIARFALAALLRQHLDEPINVINAALVAEQRHIDFSTVITSEHDEDRICIELDDDGNIWRVEGAMYEDQQPRVTNINGYAMDMIPDGHMVLLMNNDKPGRIGLVGRIFGEANCNIAEMVIGRQRKTSGGKDGEPVAMMILKLDESPTDAVMKQLREAEGILNMASLDLPPVDPGLALQE